MSTHKFDEQSVKECADILVQSVNQIRKDNDISENQDISIYVIDAPIVHSAVSQFGKHIQERTNAHSIVQVNFDAGNPYAFTEGCSSCELPSPTILLRPFCR
jgi:hypothetical protein